MLCDMKCSLFLAVYCFQKFGSWYNVVFSNSSGLAGTSSHVAPHATSYFYFPLQNILSPYDCYVF